MSDTFFGPDQWWCDELACDGLFGEDQWWCDDWTCSGVVAAIRRLWRKLKLRQVYDERRNSEERPTWP